MARSDLSFQSPTEQDLKIIIEDHERENKPIYLVTEKTG